MKLFNRESLEVASYLSVSQSPVQICQDVCHRGAAVRELLGAGGDQPVEQRPTLGEGLQHGREAPLQGELTHPYLTQQHSIAVHIHLRGTGSDISLHVQSHSYIISS